MAGVKRTRSSTSKGKTATKKATAKKAATKKATAAQKKAETAAQKKAGKKRDAKADDKQKDKDKEEIKEIKASISNGVMVDHKVPNPAAHEVVTHNGVTLDAHLMLADCVRNNNKFYIIQGLKSSQNYFLWNRWGRVGVDGQSARTPMGSIEGLYSQYNKKLNQKKNKGYNQIEISYEDVEKKTKELEKKEEKKTKKPKKESKLASSVQNFLRFIFDMKMIEKSVVKVGFNVKKLPLGQLSKKTILRGYEILKKIDAELKGSSNPANLGRLSSEFYSVIPHDFKFEKMSNFIINSNSMLKEKLDLVQTLGDIQIAAEITNEVEEADDDMNELDAKYKKLKTKIVPIEKDHKDYDKLISTITSTHGSTHYYKVKPIDVFEVVREGEDDRFSNMGNSKLLWHGSRFSNWGGILSQGLRIAPPEAPATGYMFGKGVYFADVVTKSAAYCCPHLSNKEGILALCEVALGEPRDLKNADYNASNLPKGKGSTKGVGRWVPSKEVDIEGVPAYVGPIKDLGSNYYLRYNEFITYDVNHIKIKYLFR